MYLLKLRTHRQVCNGQTFDSMSNNQIMQTVENIFGISLNNRKSYENLKT